MTDENKTTPQGDPILSQDEVERMYKQIDDLLKSQIGHDVITRDEALERLHIESSPQFKIEQLEEENKALQEKLAQYEQGFPMDTAPRDGSLILVAVYYGASEPLFDVMRCTTSEHIWHGGRGHYDESAGNVKLLRWWPLPGGYK